MEFARNHTGLVHVLRWHDPYTVHDLVELDPVDLMLAAVRAPVETLCGRTVKVTGAEHLADRAGWAVRVSEFADIDICAACVRAMGDQSHRAFEHPRPGDDQVEKYGSER